MMKKVLYSCLVALIAVSLWSCSEDNPYHYERMTLSEDEYEAVIAIYNKLNLKDLEEYRTWDISGNDLYSDTWKGIKLELDFENHIKYVTEIELKGLEYITADCFPEEFGKLSHLRHLNIQNFKFTDKVVPAQLFDCPLEVLTISNCDITSLPDEIGNVGETLKQLIITRTNITSLPDAMRNLTKLENVDLQYNHLMGKVPNVFNDLDTYVPLCYNQYDEMDWDIILGGHNVPELTHNQMQGYIPQEVIDCPYFMGVRNRLKYNHFINME